MKNNLLTAGTISLHSLNGAPIIFLAAKTGDRFQYKRNGERGMYKAKIVGWNEAKPNKICIQLYSNDYIVAIGKPLWVRNWSHSPLMYNGETPMITS